MIALVELVPNLCFSYYIVTIVICLCIIRLSALLNVFSHWLHLLVISRHNAVSTIVVDCCPKGFLRENGSALMDPLRHWGPFTFLSFIQIFICQLSPFLQLSDVFCNVFSKFTHTDHGDYEDQWMNKINLNCHWRHRLVLSTATTFNLLPPSRSSPSSITSTPTSSSSHLTNIFHNLDKYILQFGQILM